MCFIHYYQTRDMLHKITYGNGITTANSKHPHAYRTVTLLLGFYLKIRILTSFFRSNALFSFSISVYCCGLSTEFLIKLFDDDDDRSFLCICPTSLKLFHHIKLFAGRHHVILVLYDALNWVSSSTLWFVMSRKRWTSGGGKSAACGLQPRPLQASRGIIGRTVSFLFATDLFSL